ncbi:hypothetical protein [Endozoicomonas atrinae]|uniref:hypothetical protein n=1 Tax=Endozoicomonas atrinae TaxID=1333660 RepID=UPI0008247003|nr:hypothetical protein [Endozoicomonas atrinae]
MPSTLSSALPPIISAVAETASVSPKYALKDKPAMKHRVVGNVSAYLKKVHGVSSAVTFPPLQIMAKPATLHTRKSMQATEAQETKGLRVGQMFREYSLDKEYERRAGVGRYDIHQFDADSPLRSRLRQYGYHLHSLSSLPSGTSKLTVDSSQFQKTSDFLKEMQQSIATRYPLGKMPPFGSGIHVGCDGRGERQNRKYTEAEEIYMYIHRELSVLVGRDKTVRNLMDVVRSVFDEPAQDLILLSLNQLHDSLKERVKLLKRSSP